jgi:four helix bundle protein
MEESMMQLSHEKLRVYEVAVDLARFVRALDGRRGEGPLLSQLRRAADSVCLNIAEASFRAGRDRQALFLVARGSAAECSAALDILGLTGAITQAQRRHGRERVAELLAMLTSLGRPRR